MSSRAASLRRGARAQQDQRHRGVSPHRALLWKPGGKPIVGLTECLAAAHDVHPDLRCANGSRLCHVQSFCSTAWVTVSCGPGPTNVRCATPTPSVTREPSLRSSHPPVGKVTLTVVCDVHAIERTSIATPGPSYGEDGEIRSGLRSGPRSGRRWPSSHRRGCWRGRRTTRHHADCQDREGQAHPRETIARHDAPSLHAQCQAIALASRSQPSGLHLSLGDEEAMAPKSGCAAP